MRLDHLLSTSTELASGTLVVRRPAPLTIGLISGGETTGKEGSFSITSQLSRDCVPGPVAQVVRALC